MKSYKRIISNPFKHRAFCVEIIGGARSAYEIIMLKLSSVRQSIHLLVNFFKFLDGCILFNFGPIDTKLEDFLKPGVLFQNVWVPLYF